MLLDGLTSRTACSQRLTLSSCVSQARWSFEPARLRPPLALVFRGQEDKPLHTSLGDVATVFATLGNSSNQIPLRATGGNPCPVFRFEAFEDAGQLEHATMDLFLVHGRKADLEAFDGGGGVAVAAERDHVDVHQRGLL